MLVVIQIMFRTVPYFFYSFFVKFSSFIDKADEGNFFRSQCM